MNAALRTDRCACREGVTCQYHGRLPRRCACGGTLEYYAGKDGGQLIEFALTVDGFAMRGFARTIVRRGGPAWMCNRCERCEAA